MISFCDTMTGDRRQETLEHGSTEFPIACYFDDLGEKSVPWHWHEEAEAGVVRCGSIVIQTPDQKCEIHPGEGFFINSGILHAIRGGEEKECHLDSLVFHPRLSGGNVDSVFWRKFIRPVLSASGITVLSFDGDSKGNEVGLIEAAWMECVREDYGFEINVRYLLDRLFLQLGKKRPEIPSANLRRTAHYNERMKKMLTYINEHFQEHVTVRDIAASASISESECLRCFRNVLELSPIAYLKMYRLQNAADLISSTQWKISYIGGLCGFNEMSYFGKSFKEAYGCTPREYRFRT